MNSLTNGLFIIICSICNHSHVEHLLLIKKKVWIKLDKCGKLFSKGHRSKNRCIFTCQIGCFLFYLDTDFKGILFNLSDLWALKPFKVLSKESHIGNSYQQKGLFTSHRIGINLIKRELFLPSMCLLHVSHRLQINAQNCFQAPCVFL